MIRFTFSLAARAAASSSMTPATLQGTKLAIPSAATRVRIACFGSEADTRGNAEVPSSADMTPEQRRGMINMMLYRAKQRGFLELDLLMGMYAEKHIPTMSDAKLIAFNELLLEENPDLFKWLTGQQQPPEEVAQNIAFQDLFASISSKLGAHSQKASLAQPGTEWKRGWSDAGDELTEGAVAAAK